MLGGVNPTELGFRPVVTGVVDVWREFRSGDATLSPPGIADYISEPQQTIDRLVKLEFPYRAGRESTRGYRFVFPGLLGLSR